MLSAIYGKKFNSKLCDIMADLVPKAEFLRRLKRLYNDLDNILYGDGNFGNFFPHFFSLIVYFWSFPKPHLFKRCSNVVDEIFDDDDMLPFQDIAHFDESSEVDESLLPF